MRVGLASRCIVSEGGRKGLFQTEEPALTFPADGIAWPRRLNRL